MFRVGPRWELRGSVTASGRGWIFYNFESCIGKNGIINFLIFPDTKTKRREKLFGHGWTSYLYAFFGSTKGLGCLIFEGWNKNFPIWYSPNFWGTFPKIYIKIIKNKRIIELFLENDLTKKFLEIAKVNHFFKNVKVLLWFGQKWENNWMFYRAWGFWFLESPPPPPHQRIFSIFPTVSSCHLNFSQKCAGRQPGSPV